MDIKNILKQETIQFEKLNELVKNLIKEEDLISSHLLDLEQDHHQSTGQRIADHIASFGRSWTFIIGFFIIIFSWIIINSSLLFIEKFDPFPFILLNLILSYLA